MKKSFLISIFASLLLLASCSSDSDITEPISNAEMANNSRIITPKQAESFGDKAINAIFSNEDFYRTKSGETSQTRLKKRGTENLTAKSVPILSKDGKTVLYAINFGENNGFMIISADKEAPFSMLAFNDSGHFDENKLDKNNPFFVWLEEQSEKVAKELERTPNLSDEKYGIWKDMDGSTKDTEIEIELVNNIPAETKGRHKGSWNLEYESPFSTVKNSLWGQREGGYNIDAKVPGALAGCPAVAIGLLCKTHRYPNNYDYSGMPDVLNTNVSNPISVMFRDIADKIPNYKWGVNGSGALPNDILTGLHKVGYTKAKLGNYDFNTVYNNIKAWHPVLLAGYQGGGGHIWICDGYMEKTWKVTRRFLWKKKTWYEYQDMLYMNWGWNGSENGWVDQESWSNYNNNKQMYYDLEPNLVL